MPSLPGISMNPSPAVLEGLETAPLKGSPGPCRTEAAAKEELIKQLS